MPNPPSNQCLHPRCQILSDLGTPTATSKRKHCISCNTFQHSLNCAAQMEHQILLNPKLSTTLARRHQVAIDHASYPSTCTLSPADLLSILQTHPPLLQTLENNNCDTSLTHTHTSNLQQQTLHGALKLVLNSLLLPIPGDPILDPSPDETQPLPPQLRILPKPCSCPQPKQNPPCTITPMHLQLCQICSNCIPKPITPTDPTQCPICDQRLQTHPPSCLDEIPPICSHCRLHCLLLKRGTSKRWQQRLQNFGHSTPHHIPTDTPHLTTHTPLNLPPLPQHTQPTPTIRPYKPTYYTHNAFLTPTTTHARHRLRQAQQHPPTQIYTSPAPLSLTYPHPSLTALLHPPHSATPETIKHLQDHLLTIHKHEITQSHQHYHLQWLTTNDKPHKPTNTQSKLTTYAYIYLHHNELPPHVHLLQPTPDDSTPWTLSTIAVHTPKITKDTLPNTTSPPPTFTNTLTDLRALYNIKETHQTCQPNTLILPQNEHQPWTNFLSLHALLTLHITHPITPTPQDWADHLLAAQPQQDIHRSIHQHLRNIYLYTIATNTLPYPWRDTEQTTNNHTTHHNLTPAQPSTQTQTAQITPENRNRKRQQMREIRPWPY